MPTINDLATAVESITYELRERVDTLDREQKKMHEDLTSQTAKMPAEAKTIVDRMQADIDRVLDEIKIIRSEAHRPQMATQDGRVESVAKKAFMNAIRKFGNLEALDNEERKWVDYTRMTLEQKQMYAGDATTGGFFASVDFINELKAYMLLISPVRSVARVQATSGERVQMPSLQGDASAYWAVEQSTYTDSNTPTLGMINIPVHEIRGLLRVSHQNLEDSMFDLETLIKTRLGLKFAQAEGKAFVTGDGNGKPRGIMNYPLKASSGYTGGSAGKNNVYDAVPYVLSSGASGKITADDVVSVLTDLKAAYVPNATWAFTRGTLGTLRLLKDSMNRPLWQPFAAANLPSTIYDRPYIELPDMDEIASGAYPLLLGDFSYYMIVDRISLNMQTLNELYAAQGLVGFIARMRVGGDLLLPEAMRVLKCN